MRHHTEVGVLALRFSGRRSDNRWHRGRGSRGSGRRAGSALEFLAANLATSQGRGRRLRCDLARVVIVIR